MGHYLLWDGRGKSLIKSIILCSILIKSKFVCRILIKSKIIRRPCTPGGLSISLRPSQRVGSPPSSRIIPSWMRLEGRTRGVLFLALAPYGGRTITPAPLGARVEEAPPQMDALQRW